MDRDSEGSWKHQEQEEGGIAHVGAVTGSGDKVHRGFAATRSLVESLTSLLETTGLGIVQLDGRRRVVSLTDHDRLALKVAGIRFDVDQCLFVRDQQENNELQRILTHALPPPGMPGISGTAIVRRPAGRPPLVIQIHPLHSAGQESQAQPVAALLLIVDPQSIAKIDSALVGKVFGLTKAEASVAAQLSQGKNVCEIAASTHRTEDTIRTHVKRILSKLGLNRQAALVRWVRPLSVIRQSRHNSRQKDESGS